MKSNDLVLDILKYLDDNINRNVSIEELSTKFYFNRYYIMKLFKKEIGVTINNYINNVRIYNSMKEIKDTDDSFMRVALNNGFNSLEYFSETFKNIIGVSPRTYKKFTYFIIRISDVDLLKARQGVLNLQIFMNFINQYKNNAKIIEYMPKKLSIFN